jgi:hypothetical protein
LAENGGRENMRDRERGKEEDGSPGRRRRRRKKRRRLGNVREERLAVF